MADNKTISKTLKKLESTPIRSLIYAGVLSVTFLIVGALFVYSLIFLGRIVDSLLITEEEEAIPVSVFNLADFALLSKKLNIPSEPEIQTSVSPSAQTPAEPASINTTTTATTTVTQISPSEISLQILNGTSIIGLAKTWQGRFEEVGFENIAIGNAAKRNYEKTEISYKESKKEVLDLIRETFRSNGVATLTLEEKLGGEEEGYDFVIILGK